MQTMATKDYLIKRKAELLSLRDTQVKLLETFDADKTKEFITRIEGAIEFLEELMAGFKAAETVGENSNADA